VSILGADDGGELAQFDVTSALFVSAIAFAPDRNVLWIGSSTGTVSTLDLATGQVRPMFSTTEDLKRITVSPDGTRIATEPDLAFHEAHTGQVIFQCESSNNLREPRATWFLSDETGIVRYPGSTLGLYRTDSGVRGTISFTTAGFVSGAAISPDQSLLAIGTSEPAVHLWDVASGQDRHVMFGQGTANQLAFSPDGRTLATSSGGDNRLWNVGTGQELLQNTVLRSDAQFLAFSGDGRRLFFAGLVGPHEYFTILSWDVAGDQPGAADPAAAARGTRRP
jgi:WD40 repeat protein